MKWAAIGICGVVSVPGCGGGSAVETAAGPTERIKAGQPKAELKLERGPKATQRKRAAVEGIATPGIQVSADGERIFAKQSGRFRLSVPLKIGRNRITVYARGQEVRGAREDVVVRRTKPPPKPESPPAPESATAVPTPAPQAPPAPSENQGFIDPPTSSEEYRQDQIDAARERGDLP